MYITDSDSCLMSYGLELSNRITLNPLKTWLFHKFDRQYKLLIMSAKSSFKGKKQLCTTISLSYINTFGNQYNYQAYYIDTHIPDLRAQRLS